MKLVNRYSQLNALHDFKRVGNQPHVKRGVQWIHSQSHEVRWNTFSQYNLIVCLLRMVTVTVVSSVQRALGPNATNKVSSICAPFVILVRITIQSIVDVVVVFIWSFIYSFMMDLVREPTEWNVQPLFAHSSVCAQNKYFSFHSMWDSTRSPVYHMSVYARIS